MLEAVKGAGNRIARQYPKAVPLWCTTHHRVIVESCTEPLIRNIIGAVDSVSTFPLYLYLKSREFYIWENGVLLIIF